MKKWYFRERNYRTLRETVIPTKKAPRKVLIINGAISKNRTCDPVITNDVLYH